MKCKMQVDIISTQHDITDLCCLFKETFLDVHFICTTKSPLIFIFIAWTTIFEATVGTILSLVYYM